MNDWWGFLILRFLVEFYLKSNVELLKMNQNRKASIIAMIILCLKCILHKHFIQELSQDSVEFLNFALPMKQMLLRANSKRKQTHNFNWKGKFTGMLESEIQVTVTLIYFEVNGRVVH